MKQPEIITRNALPTNLGLSAVKEYLRVYDTEHDSVITLLIDAAVEFVQTYTRQTFRHTEYRWETNTQPIELPRFPVISVDDLEFTNTSEEFESISSGDLAEYNLDLSTPPQFIGDSLEPPLRITWQAGLANDADWPADLILLIWQMVEENFTARRAAPDAAASVHFSRAFRLSLEQYTTQHDAVR